MLIPKNTVHLSTENQNPQNAQSSESSVGFKKAGHRGRGGRPVIRQTGENDPYDMSIAPLNTFENQVIPVGLHNLSKGFRPNLSMIGVLLLLETKFIPKWTFEKRKNVFMFYKDFL